MREGVLPDTSVDLQQTFYRRPGGKQRNDGGHSRCGRCRTGLGLEREAPNGFELTLKAFQAGPHPPSTPTFRCN